jgi:hypothetical protein
LLTELNVHRVVITAVLLAAKFFDDAYYNNAYYAKVGGVLVSEMNGLEVDFLFRINFTLHVKPDVFDKYRRELLIQSKALAPPPPPPATITTFSSTAYLSAVNPQQPPACDTRPMRPTTVGSSSNNPVAAPNHITPSPPHDAKMAQDQNVAMGLPPYADPQFHPLYRTRSLPEPTQLGDPNNMNWIPHTCGQASYSAPPVSAPGAAYTSVPYHGHQIHALHPPSSGHHLMVQNPNNFVAAAMAHHHILPLQKGVVYHNNHA